MYRQPNRHAFRNVRRFNRFNGGGFGGRRIKIFDPSSIINNTQKTETKIEYTITHNFSDFAISDNLKRNIEKKGYKIPTPIQDQAIPAILEGRDLIGIANTGTGKTAAFLIPFIDKVSKISMQRILIITPTRELAAQIKDELFDFSKGLGIYCVLCIGGANMRRQINDLSRNPNFVIGTPGRIMDLIRNNKLNLSSFTGVVLDETDRMVDIGFLKDIKHIVSLLPKNRQSLFFSATIDNKVKDIIHEFVQNPINVSVKVNDTTKNITQTTIKIVEQSTKIEVLHKLLVQQEFEKVLVFGRTKHGVQRLADDLRKKGHRADAIHGNKRQSQRTRVLESFKRNQISILVATDVAARGLDIPNVSHVINYDLPESYDAYIHRIGRTGRANKKGVALTFVS